MRPLAQLEALAQLDLNRASCAKTSQLRHSLETGRTVAPLEPLAQLRLLSRSRAPIRQLCQMLGRLQTVAQLAYLAQLNLNCSRTPSPPSGGGRLTSGSSRAGSERRPDRTSSARVGWGRKEHDDGRLLTIVERLEAADATLPA